MKADVIARNKHAGVPCDHQILKIAGKPDLILVDSCEISEYHKWTHTVLDMILEIISGEFYVCVCYKIDDGENCHGSKNVVLKVNSLVTILRLKYLICTKLNIKPEVQHLKCEPLYQYVSEKCKSTSSLGEQHVFYPFELNNLCTLEDHNISLFCHLFKVRICLLRIEDDGMKYIYLVQISDDLDSEHHI